MSSSILPKYSDTFYTLLCRAFEREYALSTTTEQKQICLTALYMLAEDALHTPPYVLRDETVRGIDDLLNRNKDIITFKHQ
jgi:hypothetical protein